MSDSSTRPPTRLPRGGLLLLVDRPARRDQVRVDAEEEVEDVLHLRVLALPPPGVAEAVLIGPRLHDPLEALVPSSLLQADELLLGDLRSRNEDVLRGILGIHPGKRRVSELEVPRIPTALEQHDP